jgi:hypothetical protein
MQEEAAFSTMSEAHGKEPGAPARRPGASEEEGKTAPPAGAHPRSEEERDELARDLESLSRRRQFVL